MKRFIYILAFTLLGILLQFLIHAGIEIWYIGLLLKDFSTYGLGLSWVNWVMIHDIGTVVLFFTGAIFGFWQGRYWWRKIYVEHTLRRWIPWSKLFE
jgi:hypothetical protein